MSKPLTIDEIIEKLVSGERGWVHDQLDGTGMLEESLADVDESAADAKAQIEAMIADIIGDDKTATINGEVYHVGDSVPIDLSGGVGDETFKESCIAIQTNGENMAKAEARQRATKYNLTLKDK